MRRVAAVKHQVVAVGVAEERHVADTGVEGVAAELDAFRLELLARRLDVLDMESKVPVVLWLERHSELLRLPDAEARVAGPELVQRLLVPFQAEHVAVEPSRTIGVLRRDADEVELHDFHQPTEPSISFTGETAPKAPLRGAPL